MPATSQRQRFLETFEQRLTNTLLEIAIPRDPRDTAAIAAKFGRPELTPMTTVTEINPKDLGTILIFKLRKEFPEAGFYQPGSPVGSPVDQINDRVSRCVLFIEGQIVDISDHESFGGEQAVDHKFNMVSPDSWNKLLNAIKERVKPY